VPSSSRHESLPEPPQCRRCDRLLHRRRSPAGLCFCCCLRAAQRECCRRLPLELPDVHRLRLRDLSAGRSCTWTSLTTRIAMSRGERLSTSSAVASTVLAAARAHSCRA
jgi:hypothetical protein